MLTLDASEIDNRSYMLMEYCEGINLSQLVKKQGPLPIHLACDYIRQAAVELQAPPPSRGWCIAISSRAICS